MQFEKTNTQKLVSVQPMSPPTGLLFFFDSITVQKWDALEQRIFRNFANLGYLVLERQLFSEISTVIGFEYNLVDKNNVLIFKEWFPGNIYNDFIFH